MPVLAIWCQLCPKNLEGVSITLITGLINLSNNFSNYIGGFFTWILDIHKKDFNKIYIPLFIQNSYLLIAIIAILFIKFPDLTENNKETKEDEETLSNTKNGIEMI